MWVGAPDIHLFFHLFLKESNNLLIEQIFTEYLLYSMMCTRPWSHPERNIWGFGSSWGKESLSLLPPYLELGSSQSSLEKKKKILSVVDIVQCRIKRRQTSTPKNCAIRRIKKHKANVSTQGLRKIEGKRRMEQQRWDGWMASLT